MSTSDKGDKHKDNVQQRLEEARTVRKIVVIALSVLGAILIIAGISGYIYVSSALKPVDPNDDSKVSIEIPMGSSTSQIAGILEENGIIEDSMIFRFYIKFNNATQFQAGEYELSPSMKLEEIIDALQTGKVLKEPVITVTIPEGKTIEDIAALFAEKANIKEQEFLDKVNDRKYVEKLIDSYPSILSDAILDPEIRAPLEGYLFAATYEFYVKDPSVESIIHSMLEKTEAVVEPYLDSISEKDMTVHEALTMASLVENEARTEEERKTIAGVFYNRLDTGMMLQTDPTVLYALGEHKDRVLFEDLKVESPYNTYVVTGLPIGPISNFAENSLQAVLEPAETNYMYFIAADDGNIYYSETYEEHQQLTEKYLR
ncbi:endolytic transglycosylase MltG [Radiobacillus kanasensis]|uniref:endolytic transglycosylase MltG n=1 Tax=Radiobacillus kanasensis TaxID=2844358 RepID=UPI001E2CE4CF|nr:endolytic transglycosylase MltG [Radiobacillus kanasensis]UFT97865.1 endolytic transglycosylase MltG [Radiobacillus kanasensis]